VIDLDNPSGRILLGLLNAWERDAEIRQPPVTTEQEIQAPSLEPDLFSENSTPNFSPVQPGEIPFDLSPVPISPIRENFEDE